MSPESPMSMEELAKIIDGRENAKKEGSKNHPTSELFSSKEDFTYEKARDEVKMAVRFLEENGVSAKCVILRGSVVTGGGRFEDPKSKGVDIDVLYITDIYPTDFIDSLNSAKSPFRVLTEDIFKSPTRLEDTQKPGEIPGYIKLVRKDNPNVGIDMLIYNSQELYRLANEVDPRNRYSEKELLQTIFAGGLLVKGNTPPFMKEFVTTKGYKEIPTDKEFLA